jgi:predicted Zn-dependent protease
MRALCLTAFGVSLAVAQQLSLGSGLNLYSVEEELELGRQSAQQFHASLTVVNNSEITTYVDRITAAILRQMPRREYKFAITVFDDAAGFGRPENATPWDAAQKNLEEPVAFPNGEIFLPVGVLKKARTEADLIHAIAHAMAHVADRHVTRLLTRAKLIAPATNQPREDAQQKMVLASFRQQFEERADEWTRRWAAAAFPPAEQPGFSRFAAVKLAIDKL